MSRGWAYYLLLMVLLVFTSRIIYAQSDLTTTDIPFQTARFPVEHGFVNMENGNLHIEIPITNYSQRGAIADRRALVYNSVSLWTLLDPCARGCPYWFVPGDTFSAGIGTGGSIGGWSVTGEDGVASVSEDSAFNNAISGNSYAFCNRRIENTGDPLLDYPSFITSSMIQIRDRHLNYHVFPDNTMVIPQALMDCQWLDGKTYVNTTSSQAYATDGSGYHVTITATDIQSDGTYSRQISLSAPDGTNEMEGVEPSAQVCGGVCTFSVDRNGNYVGAVFGAFISPGSTYTCVGVGVVNNCYYASLTDGTDTLGRSVMTDTIASFNVNPTYPRTEYLDVPIAQGQTARYTINYEIIQVQSSFNYLGAIEGGGLMATVQSLGLPDGTSYQFTYDTYGLLQSVSLPHGGTEQFTYVNTPPATVPPTTANPYGVDFYPARVVQSYTGSSGTTKFASTFNPTSSPYSQMGSACGEVIRTATSEVTQTAHTFSYCNFQLFPQSIAVGKAYASTPDAIELFSYDFTHPCPNQSTNGCAGIQWPNLLSDTKIIPTSGGQAIISDTQYTYLIPGSGLPNTIKQWDYYTGSANTTLPDSPPGLPTRETDITYGYTVNSALFPTVTTIKDATGSVRSTTTLQYDQPNTLTASPSSTPNHNNVYVTGNRGNVTTMTKCCGVDVHGNSMSESAYLYYDDAGEITKIIDGNGNPTLLTYDPTDTFVQTLTLPPTMNGATAVAHIIGLTSDPATGQLTSVKDENQQTTSFAFDDLGRPYTTTFSNGGNRLVLQTTTYSSANETDVNVLQSNGVSFNSKTIVDGFGRTISMRQGDISVETTYNDQGLVSSITNPHAAQPSSTDGISYFAYDELGRQTVTTPPVGGATQYTYSANSVLVTDPLQHSRLLTNDAFGDLVGVTEPDLTNTLNLYTAYTYGGPSGQLTQINQMGGTSDSTQWRSRYFSYDGLNRLTSQTTPEGGTTAFVYDPLGNLIQMTSANPTNNQTTYSYDADNRLVTQSVQGGPSYTYAYDGAGVPSDQFPIGTLSSITDNASVQTLFTHDPFGHVITAAYCLPSDCTFSYNVQAGYDYQGNTVSLQYPDGRVLAMAYDKFNRMSSQVYSQWGSTPINSAYQSNLSYGPLGGLQQATFGNGVQLGATYDGNSNIASLAYLKNNVPITSKTYTWDVNGANLIGINDTASGRSQVYGYDQLDRIASEIDSGSTSKACVATLPTIPPSAEAYTLDAWGNLTQAGNWSYQGNVGDTSAVKHNQFSTVQYDNAGEVLSDNLNSYTYRSDGRLLTSNSTSYTYDAFGQRVRKDSSSSANEYIYFGGKLLAMRDVTTGMWTDRIYGPSGGAIAQVAGSQTAVPTYRIGDHLGSLVNLTDGSGNVISSTVSLPFGQLVADNSNDFFPFTDHERDTESQTDHTLFRQYSPRLGRWLSPDPSNASYNLSDPQSLNRYAYLSNRPMATIDKFGLDGDDDDCCDDWGEDQSISSSDTSISWNATSQDPDGGLPEVSMFYEAPASGSSAYFTSDYSGFYSQLDPTNAFGGLRFFAKNGQSWGSIEPRQPSDAPSSVMKTLTCASELANNYSIAGVLGLTSESFKSAHPTIASIGTGFLGNTFSGITDFGTHLYRTGTQGGGGGDIATDLAVGGMSQGLPVGEGILFKGAAGVTQDALVNLGEAGLADAFGFAKLGIDAAIFGASAIHCYNHP